MTRPKNRPAVAPVRPSLDSMSDSFELELRRRGRSKNTIYSYLLSVKLLRDYLKDNDRPLTIDVSRDDVRAFLADQRERNSAATELVRFKSLVQYFKYCVAEGDLDVSPLDGMEEPTVVRDDPPIVADEVIAKLLKTRTGSDLADRRDVAMLRLFFDTGCRLSEITNLRRCDVDLRGRTITVIGKGDKVRTVPVGDRAMAAVDRYVRQLQREHPERGGGEAPLWRGRWGRPMTTSGVTDVLHRMCDDAGTPRLHWHAFRHTYASTWLAAGGQETTLMTNAGWSNRSMLDVYARSTKKQRAHEEARRLNLGDRV